MILAFSVMFEIRPATGTVNKNMPHGLSGRRQIGWVHVCVWLLRRAECDPLPVTVPSCQSGGPK